MKAFEQSIVPRRGKGVTPQLYLPFNPSSAFTLLLTSSQSAMPTKSQWMRNTFLLLVVLFFVCLCVAANSSSHVKASTDCCAALATNTTQFYAGVCTAEAVFIDDLYHGSTGWVNALILTAMVMFCVGVLTIFFNWVLPYTRADESDRIKSTWAIAYFTVVMVLVLFASAGSFAALKVDYSEFTHCFSGNLAITPISCFQGALFMGAALIYFVDQKRGIRRDLLSTVRKPRHTRMVNNNPGASGDLAGVPIGPDFALDDSDEEDTVFTKSD